MLCDFYLLSMEGVIGGLGVGGLLTLHENDFITLPADHTSLNLGEYYTHVTFSPVRSCMSTSMDGVCYY